MIEVTIACESNSMFPEEFSSWNEVAEYLVSELGHIDPNTDRERIITINSYNDDDTPMLR